MLGLPYPGGPLIENLARMGDSKKYHFPVAFKESGELGFSFSGLKTSLRYKLQAMSAEEVEAQKKDLAASYQAAVVESLLLMVGRAVKSPGESLRVDKPTPKEVDYHITAPSGAEVRRESGRYKSIGVCGGVANNNLLRGELKKLAEENGMEFLAAAKKHCGDNAGMIAWAAWVDEGGLRSAEGFMPGLGLEG